MNSAAAPAEPEVQLVAATNSTKKKGEPYFILSQLV